MDYIHYIAIVLIVLFWIRVGIWSGVGIRSSNFTPASKSLKKGMVLLAQIKPHYYYECFQYAGRDEVNRYLGSRDSIYSFSKNNHFKIRFTDDEENHIYGLVEDWLIEVHPKKYIKLNNINTSLESKEKIISKIIDKEKILNILKDCYHYPGLAHYKIASSDDHKIRLENRETLMHIIYKMYLEVHYGKDTSNRRGIWY